MFYKDYIITKEKFEDIIKVHYQEELNGSSKFLYRKILSPLSPQSLTTTKPELILSGIKNIIALFPSHSDNIIYMLDSMHILYRVTIIDKSTVTSDVINCNSVNNGYPIKLISKTIGGTIGGTISKTFILTSKGRLIELVGNETEDIDSEVKILDFTIMDDGGISYIDNKGNLKFYNFTNNYNISELDNKLKQICSNSTDNTLYVLSVDNNLIKLYNENTDNRSLISNITGSDTIGPLICNNEFTGIISDIDFIYFNKELDIQTTIRDVVSAIFIDNGLFFSNGSRILNYNTTNIPDTNTIVTDKEVYLFTANDTYVYYVISSEEESECPEISDYIFGLIEEDEDFMLGIYSCLFG